MPEPSSLTRLADEMATYVWWHSIDLGNGLITPGRKTPEIMATEFKNTFAPIDVRNKTVLDLGAWNGGFSLEALRRGAKSVTAVDHFVWNHPGFRGRQTFDFVLRATGAKIAAVDVDLDALQLNLGSLGRFDVVLFL